MSWCNVYVNILIYIYGRIYTEVIILYRTICIIKLTFITQTNDKTCIITTRVKSEFACSILYIIPTPLFLDKSSVTFYIKLGYHLISLKYSLVILILWSKYLTTSKLYSSNGVFIYQILEVYQKKNYSIRIRSISKRLPLRIKITNEVRNFHTFINWIIFTLLS